MKSVIVSIPVNTRKGTGVRETRHLERRHEKVLMPVGIKRIFKGRYIFNIVSLKHFLLVPICPSLHMNSAGTSQISV